MKTKKVGNLIYLPVNTLLPIPVGNVCDTAKEHCKEVFILGKDHKDNLFIASSLGNEDRHKHFYFLEMARFFLINNVFGPPVVTGDVEDN